MNLISLAFSLLLTFCTKTDSGTTIVTPPITPPVVTDSTPVQYGTPFANVTDKRDAVIYQVNMRAFSSQGNFQGVIARLDSIKALGANVVYLMPIYPVGAVNSVNSPYCVKDYKGINTEFGTLTDLRALVDGAHSRNMSVILDWVANHTSWDNSWISAHKEWYLQDNYNNIVSPPGMGWADVAQLNFYNNNMRLEMIKDMKYWVYTANIDGFRCDYADGPPADFWKQTIDSLRTISTHNLLLLAEGSRTANFTAGFDYNFGFGFYGNLKSVFNNNKSALTIDSLNTVEHAGTSNGQQVVRYTSNHDIDGSDGTPMDLFGGKNGSISAFIVAAYMNSVPMVYNGQEVATPVRIVFPFTSVKIDWSINPDITALYKKLIAFRNNSLALKRGQPISYSSTDVCVFTKQQGTETVLVLANLRNKSVVYTVPTALNNSSWIDALNGGNVSISNQVTLPAYGYLVLKNQ